ncbi:transcriptional regulator family: Fungal Specific TF [Paecilomyces variotii]|nr:transcriptional regulator family: Fungal Specific TF [Paecilomyces variotii]
MASSDFMSHTSEVGSLTTHSNDESQFVGSSSGVYFIKTVRQAFSQGATPSNDETQGQDFPPPEDTIIGSEDSPCEKHPPTAYGTPYSSIDAGTRHHRWEYHPAVTQALGEAPPLQQAKELMMMYFKVWHPLFPFLHGPTFLQEMELLYSTSGGASSTLTVQSEHKSACWTTIFQCVFNLASLLNPGINLPQASKIKSPTNIHTLLGLLVYRHDTPALQAMLAAQLYLLATMSLRTASTVGGCILRSMLHAGLHRCPFRYKELTSHDRQLRKRIFWSAYAIDRYLSQALGLPLGIQDSDVDVCLPGAHELHYPLSSSSISQPQASPNRTTPKSPMLENGRPVGNPYLGRTEQSPHPQPSNDDPNWHQEQNNREAALANYVISGRLTGRALELFHKSIHVRSVRRSSVLFLISDVHKWWNGLPPSLQGTPPPRRSCETKSPEADEPFDLGPFFTVLYQHLILLINRPLLSLDTSSPDFCSGLQTCIGAARSILSALQAQIDGGQALFWPGFLSAAWMSGLVIVFACQLKQYVLSKGCQEISECLDILSLMSSQWDTAKQCHTALSSLFLKIKRQNSNDTNNPNNLLLSSTYDTFTHHAQPSSPTTIVLPSSNTPTNPHDYYDFHRHKRRKTDPTNDPSDQNTQSTQQQQQSLLLPPPPLTQAYNSNNDNAEITGSITNNNPTSWNLSGLEDLQWPGGSESATNFDLNMTDLFHGTNWDCLFDLSGPSAES